MDMSKDFYGGYSGLIETAVTEFLSRPVEPYPENIRDSKRARKSDQWIELEALEGKSRRS
jgi:hypothetical protein